MEYRAALPAMSQMIASLENELSIAAKTFIRYLIDHLNELP